MPIPVVTSTLVEYNLAAWLEELPIVVNSPQQYPEGTTGGSTGAKVYPFSAVPKGTGWPYITYHQISGDRVSWLGAIGGVGKPVVQIDCFGLTYASAKSLYDGIRLIIDGFCSANKGLMGELTIQIAFVLPDSVRDDNEAPPHGDEIPQYRIGMDVAIWFNEPTQLV